MFLGCINGAPSPCGSTGPGYSMLRLDESDLEDQGNSTCEVKLKGEEKKKAISRQDVFLEIMNLLIWSLPVPNFSVERQFSNLDRPAIRQRQSGKIYLQHRL